MHLSLSRFLSFLFLLITLHGFGQMTDKEKQEVVRTLVNSRNFRFIAQSAMAMGGSTIQLNAGNELRIMNDSFSIDLPFFGRGYDANFGSEDAGFKSTSKQFTYAADSTKSGGWNITIAPKGNPKINKMYLAITHAGYATLRINGTNQQPISYNGTIADNLSR